MKVRFIFIPKAVNLIVLTLILGAKVGIESQLIGVRLEFLIVSIVLLLFEGFLSYYKSNVFSESDESEH